MNKIEIKLSKSPKQRKDNSLSLIFEMKNTGNNNLYVLKWYTPLEGLKSNCLELKIGNKIIPYDTILINRAAPDKSDFILLKSGKKISKKFVVNDVYNVDKGGDVSIRFREEYMKVYNSIPELNNQEIYKKNILDDLKLKPEKAVKIKIKKATKAIKTKGQKLRDKEDSKKLNQAEKAKKENLKLAARGFEAAEISIAKSPIFTGANEEQQRIITDIHNRAFDKLNKIVSNMANDTNYENWFGEFDSQRFEFVKNNFKKIRDRMEEVEFDYDTSRTECDKDFMMSAYTLKGRSFIAICSRFFEKDIDEQITTLIHEHSHATAETEDVLGITNYEACLNLAAVDPDLAIKCAGNYEYFTEEM